MSVNQMTETTCPTCTSRCEQRLKIELEGCQAYTYHALPQPDLTKLREAWEAFIESTDINKDNSTSFQDGGRILFNVMQAVKEVLDAETSNSPDNR